MRIVVLEPLREHYLELLLVLDYVRLLQELARLVVFLEELGRLELGHRRIVRVVGHRLVERCAISRLESKVGRQLGNTRTNEGDWMEEAHLLSCFVVRKTIEWLRLWINIVHELAKMRVTMVVLY